MGPKFERLDMNEASSFCVGSCGSGNLSMNPIHPPFLRKKLLFFCPSDL